VHVRVPPAGHRDGAELFRLRAELDHVPAHDRREVHRLREPPERHLEVLLQGLGGMHLAGTAGHRRAFRRPRDREDVDHMARPLLADRLRREIRRSRGPRHPATPGRGPQLVRRPEVLVERRRVEVGERAGPGETVDVGGLEPSVGDGALDGLGADFARGAS
jgi:hypothetical protein